MGLKFKNILTEDEFPSKEGGKLKIKEEKLLKIIHDNVLLPFYDGNELPTELVDLVEFNLLYGEIYSFLKNVMVFDEKTLTHLFYLFVLNYNKEGEYKDIENVRSGLSYEEQIEMFGERVMFLSDHFKTLPFLIERLDFDHYGIPSYFIYKDDKWVAFGNSVEVNEAIKVYIDDRWYSEEDVFHTFGVETYLSYCSVGDTDKRIISGEESNHYESDMSDEEIIDYLSHNGSRVNYELVKEYKEMEEEWGELSSSEDGSQYELRMGEIVEEGRENVRELIYDDTYDRLENYLTEYLEELGYVSRHRDAFKNLPHWLQFSWKEFNDDEFDNFEIWQLSPYENVESVSLDNGDTYYMIQIDDE